MVKFEKEYGNRQCNYHVMAHTININDLKI